MRSLVWNTNLQADAQKWADFLASSGGGLQHDPNAGEGENLFWLSPPGDGMLSAATQDWLGEKTQYLADHGGGYNEATGHYTQVRSIILHALTVQSWKIRILIFELVRLV